MQSFQARVVSVEERTPAIRMVNNINKRNKRLLPNMTQTEPGNCAESLHSKHHETNSGRQRNMSEDTSAKSQLPLKKRICSKWKESQSGPTSLAQADTSPGQEQSGMEHFKILPGVIRHTSYPNSYLALYYHYSVI